MVSEFIIRNLTTNVVLEFNRSTGPFLLDDDSPDWGSINSTDATYPLLSSYVGVGVSKITLNVPRPITIIGWLCNDGGGTIEAKKNILNAFCNPFDTLRITCGDYTIEGHTTQPIVYSNEEKFNNNILCKFMIYITCPFPLFAKESQDSSSDDSNVVKKFVFPFVIMANERYVFGYRTSVNQIAINNKGTIETGFVMELKTAALIKGLSFTLGNQVLALKSNYSFVSNKTIKISTMAGSRGIWIKTGVGEYEPAFDIIDLDSDWIQLPVGMNVIDIDCVQGSISSLDISIVTKFLYYAMEDQ